MNEKRKNNMETAAIYHRPDSEYAYLYEVDNFHIRLRTKKGDAKQVSLISGDPYSHGTEKWFKKDKPMKLTASTDIHDYWMIETYEKTKRIAYCFHVEGFDESEVLYGDRGVFPFTDEYLEDANTFFRMPYLHEIDQVKTPEWVKETVWYQIFPERFANGDKKNDPEGTLPWGSKENPGRDDFYGGDLQGVIDHLDYLVDLGINGIYFCPLFKAKSNHKYDTIDYLDIDPDFGDKELFKTLVQEAHKRGIRVMLDAVFNHLGMDSMQWQDVLENQENSRYKDWFHINEFPVQSLADLSVEELENVNELSYDTFAFTGHMPKLNTRNLEVQEFLLDVTTYWINQFDIDAWRLDVANEVDHHFWKKFYQASIDLKEDFYILGEIWHSSQSWLQGDEFHAVMNYAYTETIQSFFMKENISASKMVAGLNEQLMLYRKQTNEVMFNMLDSHDTARLLTISNNNKQLAKAGLAFVFTQHGSPCIYYGTEIGMDGHNDPDCRKCMIWEEEKQDSNMLDFTKDLIAFRKSYQGLLSYGEIDWFDIRDDEKVVGFKRKFGNEEIICYFNQGEKDLELVLEQKPESLLKNLAYSDNKLLSIKQNGFAIYKI